MRSGGSTPPANLARKGNGKEARLSYAAFALMENRNGLLLDLLVSRTDAHHERSAALEQLAKVTQHASRRATVAGDKGYGTRGFVQGCRAHGITPHVAQAVRRGGGSAIDRRTTRHSGYGISQRVRERIEEIVGWLKTVGGFRRTRYKGRARTQLAATLTGAAYNLVRLSRLVPSAREVCYERGDPGLERGPEPAIGRAEATKVDQLPPAEASTRAAWPQFAMDVTLFSSLLARHARRFRVKERSSDPARGNST